MTPRDPDAGNVCSPDAAPGGAGHAFIATRHLAKQVGALRRRYRERLRRCRKRCSAKVVHQLRIETRRMLALLDLLDELKLGGRVNRLKKIFKRRLDDFDGLRDRQVQLSLLKPLRKQYPKVVRLRRFLRQDEARLTAKLAYRINAEKPAHVNRRLKKLERMLVSGKGCRTVKRNSALTALLPAFSRATGLRRQIHGNRPAEIHRYRVAFKRFRYMCEILQSQLPGLTEERLQAIRDYQTAAGNIQDLEVLLIWLTRLVRRQEMRSADVRSLRVELNYRKRQAIASFMAQIDDLYDFHPGLVLAKEGDKPQ